MINNESILVRVETQYFVAGMVYEVKNHKWVCTCCAPILKRTRQYQPTPYAARQYWERRKGKVMFLGGDAE